VENGSSIINCIGIFALVDKMKNNAVENEPKKIAKRELLAYPFDN